MNLRELALVSALRAVLDVAEGEDHPKLESIAAFARRVLEGPGAVDEQAAPESPEPAPTGGKSLAASTLRWRKMMAKRALANGSSNASPTPSNALANVGPNALPSLSSPDLDLLGDEEESLKDRVDARASGTQPVASSNGANALANASPTRPTLLSNAAPTRAQRAKHRYPETTAPDPQDGPSFLAWCSTWKLDPKDPVTIACATHHYGKGTLWRDWNAAVRTWRARERTNGTGPRTPWVQPVPAQGRAWKAGDGA